jgi:hypothetical protein
VCWLCYNSDIFKYSVPSSGSQNINFSQHDVVPLSFFLLATASVDFWGRGERIKVGCNLFDIERGVVCRLYSTVLYVDREHPTIVR